MGKHFFYCLSLKSGAWIMTITNFAFGLLFTGYCTIQLYYTHSVEDNLNFVLAIIMGIINFIAGGILITAIMKAKEKLVLLYLLVEMSILIIITIFTIFYMFEYESFILAGLFLICVVLWMGLYFMIGFYVQLAEYNSVTSGAIQISYNTNINPLMGLPEKAIESTAV